MSKPKKHVVINIFSIIILVVSIIYFITTIDNTKDICNVNNIIKTSLLVLFTIIYSVVVITSTTNKKYLIMIGNCLLFIFFTFGILSNMGYIGNSSKGVANLSGNSLTYAMKWATKNNIELETVYEYSDMFPEYYVISQDVKSGTKLSKVKKIVIAVSDGANPFKEVILPNMVGWESEKVLDYLEDNYFSNVTFDFVESEKQENTVIEQSITGSVKRNDEIKLTFSIGEERGYDEVKIKDLKNYSKMRAEFYLKQNAINYEFDYDFDDDIKKDYVTKQDKEPGTKVVINHDLVKVTLSKGPKIKIPDFTNMSIEDITDWAIKNKVKLKFTDKYDDNVKADKFLSCNYNKDDVIAQGTVVEITISKGQLKMMNFDSFAEFREWADKYGIGYEEQHEFSDSVKAGDVISYSYKKGDVIKNGDVVIVKISDGVKKIVPDLTGLTKSEITKKLDKLGINYNFVYKYNDNVEEGKSFKQSISSGSEVSEGTTITITISNGKAKNESNHNKENNNSNNNNSSNDSTPSTPATPQTPTCDKSQGSEIHFQAGDNAAQTKQYLQSLNPNHKFTFTIVSSCPNGDTTRGTICNMAGRDETWMNYCDPIAVTIVD